MLHTTSTPTNRPNESNRIRTVLYYVRPRGFLFTFFIRFPLRIWRTASHGWRVVCLCCTQFKMYCALLHHIVIESHILSMYTQPTATAAAAAAVSVCFVRHSLLPLHSHLIRMLFLLYASSTVRNRVAYVKAAASIESLASVKFNSFRFSKCIAIKGVTFYVYHGINTCF